MRPDARRFAGATVLVLAYGAVSPRAVPRRLQLPANLGAAGAMVFLARRAGRSWSALGLAPVDAARGIGVGALTVPAIAAVLGAAAAIPALRGFFHDDRVVDTTSAEALRKVLIDVPLETALAEELLFRSALFAFAGGDDHRGRAVVWSSLVFGVWHVLPALHSHRSNRAAAEAAEPFGGPGAVVAGTVAATAAAGAGFAALRLRSRSVLAPVIAHAALNSLAFLSTRGLARRAAARSAG